MDGTKRAEASRRAEKEIFCSRQKMPVSSFVWRWLGTLFGAEWRVLGAEFERVAGCVIECCWLALCLVVGKRMYRSLKAHRDSQLCWWKQRRVGVFVCLPRREAVCLDVRCFVVHWKWHYGSAVVIWICRAEVLCSTQGVASDLMLRWI